MGQYKPNIHIAMIHVLQRDSRNLAELDNGIEFKFRISDLYKKKFSNVNL